MRHIVKKRHLSVEWGLSETDVRHDLHSLFKLISQCLIRKKPIPTALMLKIHRKIILQF
jgi:hypothetical protein